MIGKDKQKNIQTAVTALNSVSQISTMPGGTGGKNAFYGSVDKSGKETHHAHPCHAYMKTYKDSSVVFSKFMLAAASKNVAGDYLTFLMTGPWGGLFNRFYYDSSCNGFINPKPETTEANFQHNFLVASRAIAEWAGNIIEWDRLVREEKLNSSVAFWFLSVFNDDHGKFPAKGYSREIRIPKVVKYDWALDIQTYPDSAFFNFVREAPINLNHMYADNPVYYPVNVIWGNSTQDPEENYVKLLKDRYSSYGKDTTINDVYQEDPWLKTKWTVNYNEMMDIIRQEEKRVLSSE